MAQSILIQVGQCGNQIGYRFWDLALQEHATYNPKGTFDDSFATFFRNIDSRSGNTISVGKGHQRIYSLRARGIMVDMEEGVINQWTKSPLGELFDSRQILSSTSGSGNNWGMGYSVYGKEYHEDLLDKIRLEAEACDSLQSFFLCHSIGGGTGSGLGSYITELLQDAYPEVHRFSTAIFPSADDDVVTSPYNSLLSLSKLTSSSDCILPVENQALMDICQKVQDTGILKSRRQGTSIIDSSCDKQDVAATGKKAKKPFDSMNNIVANLMLNMTSSMRFEGSLNVDINEISMNLVPFPRLKYLLSSLTPLCNFSDIKLQDRSLDQMFLDAFSRDTQLIKADPKNKTYLACALIVRGNVEISDIRHNIERMKKEMKFVSWNKEGWKTGLCHFPPVGQKRCLLTLANNSCIKLTFGDIKKRFLKLYQRKACLHHYSRFLETSLFDESLENVNQLIDDYDALDIS